MHQLPDQKQPAGSLASHQCLADEGSHRAGHQRDVPRILQPVVPGPQEDRISGTCNQPVHSQPPHGSSTLQDGDARVRPFHHQKSGVDGIDRHTRCLPSCSDASGRPQVSTLRGQQASLPVHLPPFRVSDITPGVHQAAAAHRSAVKAARCEATRLLRRLADQSRYSGTGQTARPDNHQGTPVSRMDHQVREVRPPPSQDFQFIGMQSNTRQFTVAPLPKMRLKVQAVHQHWMTNPNITAKDLHRLLGMLVFMASLVQRGRLRLRPVQRWAATSWCQTTRSWSDWITVPQWVLSEVAWWASPAILQGVPLAAKETEVTLLTDASSSGWGAQLGSRSTRGQWSASQRAWHINALEMQAVINAVKDFLPHVRSWVVRLMCDIAVTVAYIKNETLRLLKWCDRKAIMLVPDHLPGVHNIQADALSRVGQTLNTEWTMAMERLRPVFAKWGRLVCDICQQTTHQVCIAVSGPQGRVDSCRCHVHAVGRREGPPIRVPAIQDGPSSSAEDRSVTRSQGDFDRSTATGSVVVSGVDGSVPRRSDPAVRRSSRLADSRRFDRRWGDRDSSLLAVKSTRVETLQAIPRAKGHSREAASMMSRSLRQSSLQVYESHWSRFVVFCRSKRWHVFRVRSHHFSTYMMHLFRDGLLPSTIISHRTSVASVLHHWMYDPAAEPHIKLLSFPAGTSGATQNHAQVGPSSCVVIIAETPIRIRWWCWRGILGWRRSPKMADHEMWVPVSNGFGKISVVPARFECRARQMCVRQRKHTATTCGISVAGTWFPGEESATDPGPWMDHRARDCPLEFESDGSGEYAVSCETVETSADVSALESQHQRYYEEPHKLMDRGDCQGSLHSSWSRLWPSYCTWGQSPFSIMGVQLSGSPTWHPVSGVFIKNVVAVAAYSRLASLSQAKFHTKKLSPLVRPCAAAPAQSTTSAYRSLRFSPC